MFEDGEDVLDAVGVVLAVLIVSGIAIAALAAATADTRADEPPDVDWRFERVNDTHVRIVHAGGEAMNADNVVVTVGGLQRQVTWNGTVGTGDAVVIKALEGELIRVFWDAGQGNRQLLERHRVG